MIIWRCPNPNCHINNILQEDKSLIVDNDEEKTKIYEAQCGNCLKRFTLILNTQLKELKIKDKNG